MRSTQIETAVVTQMVNVPPIIFNVGTRAEQSAGRPLYASSYAARAWDTNKRTTEKAVYEVHTHKNPKKKKKFQQMKTVC